MIRKNQEWPHKYLSLSDSSSIFGRYTRVCIRLYKGYGWLWLDHVDPNHWTMVSPRSLEGSSHVRSPSARDPYPLDQLFSRVGGEKCNITIIDFDVKNVILQLFGTKLWKFRLTNICILQAYPAQRLFNFTFILPENLKAQSYSGIKCHRLFGYDSWPKKIYHMLPWNIKRYLHHIFNISTKYLQHT